MATHGTITANTCAKKSAKIEVHFRPLTDPRRRRPVYPLINIVVIAICAVICGADDFMAIAAFGRKKRQWLSRFLDLRAEESRESIGLGDRRKPQPGRELRPEEKTPQAVTSYGVALYGDFQGSTPEPRMTRMNAKVAR